MSSFFNTHLEQGFALVYIDDIPLPSNSKEHMFQPIEHVHPISDNTKHTLKIAPDKSYFMLLKLTFLGHEICYNTIKPIRSKIDAFHKTPSPTSKVALMSFIGALNFHTKVIEKLHINLKPFCDLQHENTSWSFQTLLHKLKNVLTSDIELPIHFTKHRFFITVDASVIHTTEPISFSTRTSQVMPFSDPSFIKYKNYFQVFFYQMIFHSFTRPTYITTSTNPRSCFENCISLDTSQC